jgi:hypothetical protein
VNPLGAPRIQPPQQLRQLATMPLNTVSAEGEFWGWPTIEAFFWLAIVSTLEVTWIRSTENSVLGTQHPVLGTLIGGYVASSSAVSFACVLRSCHIPSFP